MIGKHYLINSLKAPEVKRHYTISNCMTKDVYEEYMRVIQHFKGGLFASYKFHDIFLD